MHELIQGHQIREGETPVDIAAIRAALIEAEESAMQKGYSKKSIDEIWEEAKAEYRTRLGCL